MPHTGMDQRKVVELSRDANLSLWLAGRAGAGAPLKTTTRSVRVNLPGASRTIKGATSGGDTIPNSGTGGCVLSLTSAQDETCSRKIARATGTFHAS
jgi:hypothetical protein